ncbi:MAG: extracellular solute-binding protein [Alphaproteobacteria bacterium]|nr:extracellular solute-binding protein [Alphaproteobacteria bacterium]
MRIVAAIGAAILGICFWAGQAAATEINFMTWGGHYLDTYNPLVEKFAKQTGNKVNIVVMSGAKDGLTKIMAQKDDPQVDVWLSIESTAAEAEQAGLLSDLRPDLMPNLAALPKGYIGKQTVVMTLSPRGIAYRTDLVPFEIKDWTDLWDPRLKGKIGMSFVIDTGTPVIMAALLAGGSEKNIDPGFEKMKALKPNLAGFFKTDQESVKFLESGDFAVIGYAILANFYLKMQGESSDVKFVMPPKPKFLASIPGAVVKGRGAEREKVAFQFLDFLLSPESQEWVTSRFGQVPANPKAKLPETLAKVIPPLPLTDVYHVDWNVVNANYPAWNDRWNKEIQTQ